MEDSRTVVLVHGAWCGAWVWASVQTELDKKGIRSFAIDLPGHGASTLELSSSLHDDAKHVSDTLTALSRKGIENPVLVGHSYGGAVITEAASINPRVSHLVYLCAMCPIKGETAGGAKDSIEGWLPDPADGLRSVLTIQDDGTCSCTGAGAQNILFSDDDVSAEIATCGLARLDKQPLATFADAVQGDPRASTASTYVVCSKDRVVLPPNQEKLALRCHTRVQLDTGHMAQISQPAAVAQIIATTAGVQKQTESAAA